MFNNIGRKIKNCAEAITWIGIIICILVGLVYIVLGIENEANEMIVSGILVILVGSLSSWIGSFLLYGFGQLIENSDIIAKSLSSNHDQGQEQNDIEKIKEIMNNEYFNSSWEKNIKNLSDEELQERANSEEWQPEYRVLCMQELENRK